MLRVASNKFAYHLLRVKCSELLRNMLHNMLRNMLSQMLRNMLHNMLRNMLSQMLRRVKVPLLLKEIPVSLATYWLKIG